MNGISPAAPMMRRKLPPLELKPQPGSPTRRTRPVLDNGVIREPLPHIREKTEGDKETPVMGGAVEWIYLNWFAVCGLLALFLWRQTQVLAIYGPHASVEAIVGESLHVRPYFEWYVKRMKDGSSFWFPDMLFAYFIPPVLIGLQIYLCVMKDKSKMITFVFSLPNMLMATQMICNVHTDTLLYLNMLPKGAVCGCLNATDTATATQRMQQAALPVPLHDCQCIVPYHEGAARVQAANLTNVTQAEYLAAGVDPDHLPPANLTVRYYKADHDVDSLNTWDTDAFTWVFALMQCSIFVVLTRLRPFLLYQGQILKARDNNLFSSTLSHYYYLMTECFDSFTLYEEFFEHGYYFVDRVDLVWATLIPTGTAFIFLMFSSSPSRVRRGDAGDKTMPALLKAQMLCTKGAILLLVNVPLLVIRCYLVSLYGDEVKIGIIFALLIVRESVMVFMGVLEVVYEIKVFCEEKKVDPS